MRTFLGYLRYLRPYRGALLLGIVFSAIYGGSGFLVPWTMENAFRRFFEERGAGHSIGTLLGAAGLLVGAFTLRGLAGFYGGYLMTYCGVRVACDLRSDVFDKLQQLPLGWFSSQQSGDLIAKVNEDTRQVQEVLLEVAADSIRQPALGLAAVGYLVYQSIRSSESAFLLLVLVAAPVLMLPTLAIRRALKRRGREYQDAIGVVTSQLSENLAATEEVRAFQLERSQGEAFRGKVDHSLMIYLRVRTLMLTQQPAMEVISVLVLCGSFIYAYGAGISYAQFAALGTAVYFAIDPIKRTLKSVANLHRSEGAAQRIEEVLQREPSIVDPVDPVEPGPLRGELVFDDVRFRYERSDQDVLRGISVEIPAGQTVALVGLSGGGKSTFARLIPRLYDVTGGALRIDGHDVRQLRVAELRRQVALVSQQPVLFDLPVVDNIRLGRPEASDEEVEAAARAAGAHEFISAFDSGYATLAGEGGSRLSVGQKQRVAIARAFLREAPILLLDEATSALDSETEQAVTEALTRLIEGRTALIIAHRFSAIKGVDRVLVFQDGTIVEDGSPAELIAAGGVYAELRATQIG